MKNFFRIFSLFFVISVLFSCASNPYAPTNRIHKKQAKVLTKQLRQFPPEQTGIATTLPYVENWVGTTNFNLRKPNYVVIHHTAQESVEQTLKTFTLPRTQVSAHYVIGKDGAIYNMLNDFYRGWHGGAGKWGNNTDLNSSSIGIELDNNGEEEFSKLQIESLLKLLKVLKEKHNIPDANFIGHSDIAPSRKVDPNPNFPWEKLAGEGYGLWYDEVVAIPETTNDSIISELPTIVEEGIIPVDENEMIAKAATIDGFTMGVSPEIALRIIGYDTNDLESAIKAFKLHFIQKDINSVLSDGELKILDNLYKKYL
jgi:N-acetylmuramoyl-L-alanine amidase